MTLGACLTGIRQVAGRAQGGLLRYGHLMTAMWLGRHLLLTGCAPEVCLMGVGLVSCCLTLDYSLGEGSETGVRQRVSVGDAPVALRCTCTQGTYRQGRSGQPVV